MTLLGLTIFALAANLPFGYWRSRTRKFGPMWIFCVHAPVPMIIAARLFFSQGYGVIPVLVAASAAGQVLGGKLPRAPRAITPCADSAVRETPE